MRAAPLVRAGWPAAVSAWLAACGFDPQPQSGSVSCKPQGTACCPAGYVCVGRGVATTGGPAAGTCWNKRDLPKVALALAHDSTPTIPSDPVCLVTDWLPSATEPDAGPPAILADAAPTPPTGTGGSGGRFPDAPWGPEASASPDTADAPVVSSPGDVLDSSAERSPEVAGERPGIDGAVDGTFAGDVLDSSAERPPEVAGDGPGVDGVVDGVFDSVDAAGPLDAPVDLPSADVAADTRSNSGGVVTVIAANGDHTCAVVDGQMLCWGENTCGQLGNNSTALTRIPSPVLGLPAGEVTAMALGFGHTCALVNGGVQCWGCSDKGQVGNGSNSLSMSPVPVVGLESGVTAISAHASHACALVNGGMRCWGENFDYELGDGTKTDRNVPVQVSGLNSGVTAIATGGARSCAVVDGGLRCWGANWSGQLGDDTTTWRQTPVQVLGLETGVTAVAVGDGHTCAVVNGGVFCWGNGGDGQLGNGTKTDARVPMQVVGITDGATGVAASTGTIRNFACAIVAGGVKCWGSNFDFQCGDGSGIDSLTPVQAVGLAGVTQLVAGDRHACALAAGTLKCWGLNEWSQAGGDAKDFYVRTPTTVVFP